MHIQKNGSDLNNAEAGGETPDVLMSAGSMGSSVDRALRNESWLYAADMHLEMEHEPIFKLCIMLPYTCGVQ
jgi:hypothetical protein